VGDYLFEIRAPYYFHTVVGGDHNPYFGLKFDASGSTFNSGGVGIGLFEDPIVEPLIKGFFASLPIGRAEGSLQGRRYYPIGGTSPDLSQVAIAGFASRGPRSKESNLAVG
jgi:hypothetical protein